VARVLNGQRAFFNQMVWGSALSFSGRSTNTLLGMKSCDENRRGRRGENWKGRREK